MTMSVEGKMFVAGKAITGAGAEFTARTAATGTALDPVFRTASPEQWDLAIAAADAAAPGLAASSPQDRAGLLDAIGEAILAIGDELIERAMAETALPRPRLEGERMRTVNQLRLFAAMLRQGDHARVRIDRADPARAAGPKPDLRLMMVPLGPVAVFGASNFPLAFSVGGGDTASALAAGCPVVVKGHPAHPGTGELVAAAISAAIAASGFDPGIFSFLQDGGIAVGQALAADPRIKAVGFTGSRRAGEALIAIARSRAEPIPVYAEMSASNPVLLLPARLEEAAEDIAAAFVGALTLGVGQFCTNPGLVLAIDGPACDRFLEAAASALTGWTPATMLTPAICEGYTAAAAAMAGRPAVRLVAESAATDLRASARLFEVDATAFLDDPAMGEEIFGPSSLVVRCRDLAEMARVLSAAGGQLTVSLHLNDDDHDAAAALLPLAMTRAGRVLANGFGTGVEVSPAMVHGGPWPSTSDSRTTSVGTLAIERFQRPVCLQDIPEALLPLCASEANPWGQTRQVL